MHPFGMSDVDQRHSAGAEVTDWQAAEQAEIAAVELRRGDDDFEMSIQAWLRYVRAPFRPFVYAWVAAIAKRARVPLSTTSLKKLRGMMRRDVDESAGMLWDASPEVIEAWRAWYPDWIEALIAERAASDAWFLLPAEEYHRRKRAQQARDDAAQKQRQRDIKVGADLFEHVTRHGGIVRWRPGLLAQAISSRKGGRRVDARKVAEMAAALVRVDAAKWKRAPSGKAWAMELTEQSLKH